MNKFKDAVAQHAGDADRALRTPGQRAKLVRKTFTTPFFEEGLACYGATLLDGAGAGAAAGAGSGGVVGQDGEVHGHRHDVDQVANVTIPAGGTVYFAVVLQACSPPPALVTEVASSYHDRAIGGGGDVDVGDGGGGGAAGADADADADADAGDGTVVKRGGGGDDGDDDDLDSVAGSDRRAYSISSGDRVPGGASAALAASRQSGMAPFTPSFTLSCTLLQTVILTLALTLTLSYLSLLRSDRHAV